MIFLVVSLRRLAPNTSEQRSRSGLCNRVIRREATETEGLVICNTRLIDLEVKFRYKGTIINLHLGQGMGDMNEQRTQSDLRESDLLRSERDRSSRNLSYLF